MATPLETYLEFKAMLNRHGYHNILQRRSIPSGLRVAGASFVLQRGGERKTHVLWLCEGCLRAADINPAPLCFVSIAK